MAGGGNDRLGPACPRAWTARLAYDFSAAQARSRRRGLFSTDVSRSVSARPARDGQTLACHAGQACDCSIDRAAQVQPRAVAAGGTARSRGGQCRCSRGRSTCHCKQCGTDALRLALGRIDPIQSQVFCLACLDDLSYRQIAEQLRLSETHVGVLLHRAKASLRHELQAFDPRASLKSEVSP